MKEVALVLTLEPLPGRRVWGMSQAHTRLECELGTTGSETDSFFLVAARIFVHVSEIERP